MDLARGLKSVGYKGNGDINVVGATKPWKESEGTGCRPEETIQATALLKSARILRSVLGDLRRLTYGLVPKLNIENTYQISGHLLAILNNSHLFW